MDIEEGISKCLLNGIQIKRVHSELGTYLLFRSGRPLRTLNSSPWGGGFGYHSFLINRQVNKDYHAEDPIEEMNLFLLREGLRPEGTASMLTAALVKDVGFHSEVWENSAETEDDQLQVCAYVTVGLSNIARAGKELPLASLYPGTINTLVIINGILTDAAMVNAVITATEAKTAALTDLGIFMDESGSSKPATGTTTDAVLVATTERGSFHRYAGTATRLGYCIGRSVYESVMTSGTKYTKRPY
jgi:adenosylcobinamide hydrolase